MRYLLCLMIVILSAAPLAGQSSPTAAARQTPRAIPTPAARGGGAQADFDTLIDLITATIAPTTWDDVGGEGSIQGFPTGVFVDSTGILQALDARTSEQLAPVWKRQSLSLRETLRDQDLARSSPLRKVSLVRLLEAWQQGAAEGLPPTEAMRHLAGLARVDYLVLDEPTGDVILAGPAGPWVVNPEGRTVLAETGRPVLWLDDLVVLLRNAFQRRGQFMCAITPTREGLARAQAYAVAAARRPLPPGGRDPYLRGLRESLGLQQIEVAGIDPGSRVARVIVEADYHMKQIGIGLQPGTDGVPSYLERLAAERSLPTELDVLRWWFTLHPQAVECAEAGRVYVFHSQAAQVLSENELLTARGDRIHTGRSQPLNEQFARDFTREFPELAERYPVYADLDNLLRLAIAAALIETERVPDRFGWSVDPWLDAESYVVPTARVPRWTESIINHQNVNARRFVAVVSGGVSFRAEQVRSPHRRAAHDLPIPARLVPREAPRWWWD